ncbi:MAG: hypothetical protein J6R52_04000 [Alphaproteobacteria bacterium]|nr:hypothetical protein [Alphaproteobacteria bacterium]
MVAPVVVAAGRVAVTQGAKIVAKQTAKAAVKQGAKTAAKTAAKQGAKAAAKQGAKAVASKSAGKIVTEAMPTISRLAKNPRVAGRFLGTKAGKKAMFNFGIDFLNSKEAMRAIEKFVNNNMRKMSKSQEEKYTNAKNNVRNSKEAISSQDLTPEQVQEIARNMKQSIAEMRAILEQLEGAKTAQNQAIMSAAYERQAA